MKKMLAGYAAYNVWANQRFTDIVINLPEETIHRDVKSSFPSVYKTLLHMWSAEWVWWQRMKLVEQPEWVQDSFSGTIMEVCNNLITTSKHWKEWVDIATDASLQHEFIYRNSKKEQFKQPVCEVLHHLFNHQSYHRGQLVSIFHQLDVKPVPNTDLIVFFRKK